MDLVPDQSDAVDLIPDQSDAVDLVPDQSDVVDLVPDQSDGPAKRIGMIGCAAPLLALQLELGQCLFRILLPRLQTILFEKRNQVAPKKG